MKGKERKGRSVFLLAVMLTAVLWVESVTSVSVMSAPVVSVSAAEDAAISQKMEDETGSIRILLKDLEAEGSIREGVGFGLWKVGTVDANGTPRVEEGYGIGEYPQDSGALDAAAEKISGALAAAGKEPDRTETTDQGGCLLFDQVEPGVYLLRAGEDNPYGVIAPFLVQLPYWEEVEGRMEGPVYEVSAEPKASPHPSRPEASGPGRESAAKTGDETSPAGYLLMLAVTVLALGAVAVLRRKELKKEREEGERRDGR